MRSSASSATWPTRWATTRTLCSSYWTVSPEPRTRQGRARSSFWAVRRALEGCARRRPLVLYLEDLHWAEPTFLDLVEYLFAWSRDTPILLVCIARPELVERRPTLIAPNPSSDALALDPLTPVETATLLELVSGGLRDDVRERIGAAAEGNPLFVEQMAAMLEEGDADPGPAIPPTIQALLGAHWNA